MDKIAAILYKQLDEKVALLQNSLSDGRAKDFPEYQRVCGEIRGLLTARQYITSLVNNMEKNDE